MNPIIRLDPELNECNIAVQVMETSNSGSSGSITLRIGGGADSVVLVRVVSNLNQSNQKVVFQETPKNGGTKTVTATLTLDTGETSLDSRLYVLCNG